MDIIQLKRGAIFYGEVGPTTFVFLKPSFIYYAAEKPEFFTFIRSEWKK